MAKPAVKVKIRGRARSGEAQELRDIVMDIIINDVRFKNYAQFLTNVRFFWSLKVPTACAGIGFIFFNPDFYASIPPATRVTVIAHEMWHLILRHLQRRKEDDDPYYKNIAEDHAINLGLEIEKFTFEGTDPCKDPKYRGMSSTQIYNQIWQAKPSDRPSVDPTQQMTPQQIKDLIQETVEAMDEEDQQSMEELEDEAEEEVEKAKQNGCGRGSGNSGIDLEISGALVPIIGASYKDVFKDFLIDPLSGGKRTFMRPNRRSHGSSSGLMLPGRYPRRGREHRLTHLTYALDVSGSITSAQAKQFHNSVRSIKKLLNPEKLTIIFFDDVIILERTFTDKEPYGNIHVKAGGGTNLAPVYKRVTEIMPEALVIFTDLQVSIPKEPPWHTIWLVPTMLYADPNLYGDLYLIPEVPDQHETRAVRSKGPKTVKAEAP